MGVRRGPYKGRSSYARTTAAGLGAEWRRVRLQVLERDHHVCHYCGGHATTVDHVVPRIRGGSNKPENLVAACESCNYSKGARQQPAPARVRVTRAGWYSPFGGGPCSQQWLPDFVWVEEGEAPPRAG